MNFTVKKKLLKQTAVYIPENLPRINKIVKNTANICRFSSTLTNIKSENLFIFRNIGCLVFYGAFGGHSQKNPIRG